MADDAAEKSIAIDIKRFVSRVQALHKHFTVRSGQPA
jgi:hypothetical protein